MVLVCSLDALLIFFFFSSRRRHTRCSRDWSSDVCSSDLHRGRRHRDVRGPCANRPSVGGRQRHAEDRWLRPRCSISRNPGRGPRPLEPEGEDRPAVPGHRGPHRDARPGSVEAREVPRSSGEHGHHRDHRPRAGRKVDEGDVHDDRPGEGAACADHGQLHEDTPESADGGVRDERQEVPRRLRVTPDRRAYLSLNGDNGSLGLLEMRARIGRVASVGPPNGGSPAPRPRLLAEDLLLYDSDGQSLLDDHALRILIALHQESLTAQEIATRYRVPIAACYRRIRRLVSLDLISEAGFVTEGRRRPARLYKSEVDRFQIMYGNGKMLLQLLLRNGTEAKTVVGVPPDVGVSERAPPPPHEVGQYPSA